mmetsp:Transcript_2518/g.5252  ORF Transcript_2518/g.5252 Transcript_2518/m.5252 type:complete len:221 (-) Transcript_2518:600-1262(-)
MSGPRIPCLLLSIHTTSVTTSTAPAAPARVFAPATIKHTYLSSKASCLCCACRQVFLISHLFRIGHPLVCTMYTRVIKIAANLVPELASTPKALSFLKVKANSLALHLPGGNCDVNIAPLAALAVLTVLTVLAVLAVLASRPSSVFFLAPSSLPPPCFLVRSSNTILGVGSARGAIPLYLPHSRPLELLLQLQLLGHDVPEPAARTPEALALLVIEARPL